MSTEKRRPPRTLPTETRRIDELVLLDQNPKLHPEEQIEELRASIRMFGFTVPALIDEKNKILAGNGRVIAAMREGLKEIPVIVAKGWTRAMKKAYVIADNKLTEKGGWDKEILAEDFKQLVEMGFDVEITGFEPVELGRMEVPGFGDQVEKNRLPPGVKYVVIVECNDEADQTKMLERFAGEGLKVKAQML